MGFNNPTRERKTPLTTAPCCTTPGTRSMIGLHKCATEPCLEVAHQPIKTKELARTLIRASSKLKIVTSNSADVHKLHLVNWR